MRKGRAKPEVRGAPHGTRSVAFFAGGYGYVRTRHAIRPFMAVGFSAFQLPEMAYDDDDDD